MRVSFIGDHLTANAVGVQILALPSPILANSEEYRSGDALKSLKVIKKNPFQYFKVNPRLQIIGSSRRKEPQMQTHICYVSCYSLPQSLLSTSMLCLTLNLN